MLDKIQWNKLQHGIKRAAHVLQIIRDEEDHVKQKALISLLSDELSRMSDDITSMTEME